MHLVVTDHEMPEMNGLERPRLIKVAPTLADKADVTAGKATGVTAYEIKQDKGSLLESIWEHIA